MEWAVVVSTNSKCKKAEFAEFVSEKSECKSAGFVGENSE